MPKRKECTTEPTPCLAEWISVKDRLPKDEKAILLYDAETGHNPMLGWYEIYESGASYFVPAGCIYLRMLVTHWMPIPELPK